ncbi:MAG: hypothetical protein GSR77_06000 [Desulfurococcales archaeon]|nr:hypothetical protein [Desulfurococcales archaeon]
MLLLMTVLAITMAIASIIISIYLLRQTRNLKRSIEILTFGLNARRLERKLSELAERPRKRYVVFEIVAGQDLSEADIRRSLYELARDVLGESGFIKSGFQLVYFNNTTNRGIIRVREPYKLKALGVLGLLREISGVQVLATPLSTSGTIKRAKKIADMK